MKLFSACAGVLSLAATAAAQSINVAIGPLNHGLPIQPSSGYAAAGIPGYWNGLQVLHNTTTFNLKDINGATTPVNVWQYGGTELRSTDDPGTTGDDALLMDYCQVTYTPSLETCLFFRQLEYGEYEVLIYAMMPGQPTVLSYTSSDEEPGYPHEIIGGAWPGGHQEGVTFSRHYCIVGPPQGLLRTHSGIVPGQNPAMGAAFNGIQLRKLPALALGDMNCSGAVDGADISGFVKALLDPNAYYPSAPNCRIDNADITQDGQITTGDIQPFVAMLTS